MSWGDLQDFYSDENSKKVLVKEGLMLDGEEVNFDEPKDSQPAGKGNSFGEPQLTTRPTIKDFLEVVRTQDLSRDEIIDVVDKQPKTSRPTIEDFLAALKKADH